MVKKRTCRGLVFWLALAALGAPQVAAAQDVMATSGDWQYGADTELAAASTRNAQGWLFGLVCSPDCIGNPRAPYVTAAHAELTMPASQHNRLRIAASTA